MRFNYTVKHTIETITEILHAQNVDHNQALTFIKDLPPSINIKQTTPESRDIFINYIPENQMLRTNTYIKTNQAQR